MFKVRLFFISDYVDGTNAAQNQADIIAIKAHNWHDCIKVNIGLDLV